MRKVSNRARLFISSYYIGSGNIVNVFKRRVNQPYEKVREVYGEELQRIKKSIPNNQIDRHSLTIDEKIALRSRLIKEGQVQMLKQMIALFIAIVIAIGLYYGFMAFLSILKEIFTYEQEF